MSSLVLVKAMNWTRQVGVQDRERMSNRKEQKGTNVKKRSEERRKEDGKGNGETRVQGEKGHSKMRGPRPRFIGTPVHF